MNSSAILGTDVFRDCPFLAIQGVKFVNPPFVSQVFLITLRNSQSIMRRVQLLWNMSARLRVSMPSLLLELASCFARAPVPLETWARLEMTFPSLVRMPPLIVTRKQPKFLKIRVMFIGSQCKKRSTSGHQRSCQLVTFFYSYKRDVLAKTYFHPLVIAVVINDHSYMHIFWTTYFDPSYSI